MGGGEGGGERRWMRGGRRWMRGEEVGEGRGGG